MYCNDLGIHAVLSLASRWQNVTSGSCCDVACGYYSNRFTTRHVLFICALSGNDPLPRGRLGASGAECRPPRLPARGGESVPGAG